MAMLSLICLVTAVGVSLAATRLTIRINQGQETTNLDTLVPLDSQVSFTCDDDVSSEAGDLFFNEIATTLTKMGSAWIITSMSVTDQGAYKCCVGFECQDLAVITVPQDTTVRVIVADGEQPTLSCPLEIAMGFSQHYHVVWRVPVDVTVAASGSGVIMHWASLNVNTLELTVGPLNSTLPRVFECVVISFTRGRNVISFSNSPKGTVNITIPYAQQLQVKVSPSVIPSGSSDQFSVSCGVENGQVLYNPQYQFFHNGMPTGAPSDSPSITFEATSTGNFTCNATQYSDQMTPILNQQSPPVQAIILDSPSLTLPEGSTGSDNDCMQEVRVSIQQPVPDEMYFAFSSEHTESCVGLRVQTVNITTDERSLTFTVNVGDSGLDTRKQMYLISWYVMDDTMSPCTNLPMGQTVEACPPTHTVFTPGVIAAIAVAFAVIIALVTMGITIGVTYGIVKYRKRHKDRGFESTRPKVPRM